MGEARKVARTSGIGLYEYLAQQVLDQQPQHIRDFLLNTSLLEEFNEDLCEIVIGKALSKQANWNVLMDHVIQNNLFVIPVGEKSLWLRYHHLFRDFLQAVIQNNRPEDARKIKLELAQYFRGNGNWEKVFEIYDSLGEKEAILLTQKKHSLNHLYSEALRAKGVILYQKGQLREGLVFLEKAIHICDENQREEDTARILFEVGAIHEALGQIPEAEQAYTRSLAYWQSVGDSIWQPTILNNLGVLQHKKGDFVNSFYNLEKSMYYSRATGNQRMEGYSLASIGDLYRDLSALEEAEDAYQKALEIALMIEDQFLIFYLKTVQSRLSTNKNQFVKAQLQILSAQTIAKKSGSLYEINKYNLEQSVLDFWTDNYEKAIENLLMSADFFGKEGHIEDAARNQFYLFLSFIKVGKLEKSNRILDDIMEKLPEPQWYLASMSAAYDAKNVLKPLTKKKDLGVKISRLFKEIDQFQKLTQKSRRIIRKQASFVPFAPAKIIIRAFGSIEVMVNNRILKISDWKTQTSRDLLLLFLAHPEGLTKEEVGVVFWPDASPSELKLRFKNAIYRMRHAVGSDVVNFQDNYYLFNRAVDYEYDVQNFIAAVKKASEKKDLGQKIEAYEIAVSLYKGSYLPRLDDTWVITDRESYLETYRKAAEELALLYINNKEFESSLEISQLALKFDPYNEPLHRICMRVYAAPGNKPAVSHQFKKCRKILLEEIGIQPSSQTISLYESLINE